MTTRSLEFGSSYQNRVRQLGLISVYLVVILIFSMDPYTIQRALGVSLFDLNLYLSDLATIAVLTFTTGYAVLGERLKLPMAIFPLLLFVGYLLLRGIASFFIWPPIDVVREFRVVPYYLLVLPFLLLVRSRRDCWRLVGAMLAGSVLSLLLFTVTQFGVSPPGLRGQGRLTRQFVNEITLFVSAVFALTIAIGYTDWRRKIALVMAIVFGWGVFASHTETLYILAIISVPLFIFAVADRSLIRWSGWVFVCAIAMGAGLLLLILSNPYLADCVRGVCIADPPISIIESFGIRVKEWAYWTQLFTTDPVFGIGIGIRYQSLVQAPGDLVGGLAGSSAIFWLLAKLGLVGLFVYAWAWIAGSKLFIHRWHLTASSNRGDWVLLTATGISAIAVFFKGAIHSNGVTSISSVVILVTLITIVYRIGWTTNNDGSIN